MSVVQNYWATLIIGLLFLAGIIVMVLMLKRKHPDLEIGKIFNLYIVNRRVSTIVFAIVAVNVFEAMWAGSVSGQGEVPIPPAARFGAHFTVQFMSMLAGINFIPMLSSAIKQGWDKSKLALAALLLVVALGFPYLNMIFIASALGQMYYLWNFWSDPLYYLSVQHVGLTGSMTLYIVHIFATLWDGLEINTHEEMVDLAVDGQYGGDVNTNINERGKKENIKNAVDAAKNKNIAFLINRVLREKASRKQNIERATKILDGMLPEDQALLAYSVMDLKNKIEKFDRKKSNLEQSEIDSKNNKFNSQIRELFQKSTKKGQGFGIVLPKN